MPHKVIRLMEKMDSILDFCGKSNGVEIKGSTRKIRRRNEILGQKSIG